MKRGTDRDSSVHWNEKRGRSGSTEWILELPGDLLEPHPLVRELRHTLEAKEAALADKEQEITRLQVALAFGLKELPLGPVRSNERPAR
jgi:hypothetical protein